MDFLNTASSQFQTFIQLLIAMILGGILGLERELRRKEAGLRTYALVSLGSALFTIIGLASFQQFITKSGVSFDPSRVINAVATGIGFIGAGIIMHKGSHIEGLTTAAGLWLASAIGVAVGAGLQWTAFYATILGVIILSGLRLAEEKVLKKKTDTETEVVLPQE